MTVGIEAMSAYLGRAAIDVTELMSARGLELSRATNLMMDQKSVYLPFEDSVSFAINAAKPLIDALDESRRSKIECVITATESGLDFSKSLSTYVGSMLGLERNCRYFEVKQACYGGTAAFRMACAYIDAHAQPDAQALVLCTDLVRPVPREYIAGDRSVAAGMAFAEPSSGAGAVAMLISRDPAIFQLDPRAYGVCGFESFDTCRPSAELELGNSDLSLLTYLDCVQEAFDDYCRRAPGVDFRDGFRYQLYHTPFAGMVRGAHRTMLRKHFRTPAAEAEADFEGRVLPSLAYARRVGNIMSGSLYLALISLLDHARLEQRERIGLFSYGSGCSSEFFSGFVDPFSQQATQALAVREQLDARCFVSPSDYDTIQLASVRGLCGVSEGTFAEHEDVANIYERQFAGTGLAVLDRIEGFHREYRWS